ncbi:carboxylating nicotinate-nucleotide diphosphorylase [Candidatus Providencia siddallii]|uniref:nicotinate-nucleotide diphosphorylase (carboxylating) n=1 Tax=Candidatus Providencia siddallii TaxID=1715285 RepID=A0ABP1CH02_9GAMM
MCIKKINTLQTKENLLKKLITDIPTIVSISLKEDLNYIINYKQDITSQLINKNLKITAKIITRESCIFCGKKWVDEVFFQLGNKVKINWFVEDGDFLDKNQTICNMIGDSHILLAGERTSLNFIQTLSSISTITAKYVKQLEGTKTKLLDTRKTIPGLRTASKYAVLIGGGFNHRFGLTDLYLIKENHIFLAGSIEKIIKHVKNFNNNIHIEIEVKNLEELLQAINLDIKFIMLDNFSSIMIKKAVDITNGKAFLEASGNITIKNIKEIAKIGVDFISTGALTKNIKAIDLSMLFN